MIIRLLNLTVHSIKDPHAQQTTNVCLNVGMEHAQQRAQCVQYKCQTFVLHSASSFEFLHKALRNYSPLSFCFDFNLYFAWKFTREVRQILYSSICEQDLLHMNTGGRVHRRSIAFTLEFVDATLQRCNGIYAKNSIKML